MEQASPGFARWLGAVALAATAGLATMGAATAGTLTWDLDFTDNGTAVQFSVYGGLQSANLFLDGQVAYAHVDQNVRRSVGFSNITGNGGLNGGGAQVLRLSAAGLVVNGAPAGDAAVAALQAKLGFQLPLAPLRYWLLGVPQPGTPFILVRNADDRAEHLEQDGWSIAYDRYLAAAGDRLPQRLVLTRGDVRVRLIVDRWDFAQ